MRNNEKTYEPNNLFFVFVFHFVFFCFYALFSAQALERIAQFGREICSFTEQGVTTDTVVHLPKPLAFSDHLSQVFTIVTVRPLRMGVECKCEEKKEKEHASTVKDVTCHGLRKSL